MLALLSGRNAGLLLQPSHWMSAIDGLPDDTGAWAVAWGIHPQARIEVMPPLAGFVGSDLLAGVMTTHLTENGAGNLLIDFGINSEIALWDGQTLWVTSAAGGPAFEGSGIRCGLPAEPGAIHRVRLRNGALDFAVIAGGEPRGICGSGLVDLIAGRIGPADAKGSICTHRSQGGIYPVLERAGHRLDKKGRGCISARQGGDWRGRASLAGKCRHEARGFTAYLRLGRVWQFAGCSQCPIDWAIAQNSVWLGRAVWKHRLGRMRGRAAVAACRRAFAAPWRSGQDR